MVNGVNNYLNSYYGSMGLSNSGGTGATNQIFDYKAAQNQTKSLLDSYKQGKTQVKQLTSDSAAFLNNYTAGMKAQNDAASKLTGGNLNALLYDKEGKITDETIKATVDATQKMVDANNANLALLDKNADRGAGVMKQMARMVSNPVAEKSMAMVGISMNKDGTLKLDAAKLTEALKTTNEGNLKLYKDILGGYNGVAGNLQKDAAAGMRESAASLINNDIAKMQEIQKESSFANNDLMMYGRAGAHGLNNMAAVGMMMNFLA